MVQAKGALHAIDNGLHRELQVLTGTLTSAESSRRWSNGGNNGSKHYGGCSFVMVGLVPAIHVFVFQESKTWMPGTRPGMTTGRLTS
jgi:hypothetical protein